MRRATMVFAVAAAAAIGWAGSLAWGAFSSTTSTPAHTFTAAPDLTAPTASAVTVARASGGTAGTIRQGGTYYVYAAVTDTGNPASGVATVTADVASFDTGVTAAALTTTGGPWTVGGTSYTHRSAQLTSDTPLTTGNAYAYTVTSTDAAGNSRLQSGWSATIETYNSVVLGTSGLVSYWRLGETTGTAAADGQGTNTGAYTNSPTLGASGALTGDANGAVGLDGTNDYVNVPDAASLDITGAVSLEAWIKVRVFDLTWQAIVTKGDSAYRLHRNGTSNFVAWDTSGLSNVNQAGTRNVNDGAWHHVVVTWNNAGVKRIYVDGTLDVELTGVTGTLSANAHALRIGENAQATGRYFDGWIDEVAVYNTALGASTVLDHYNAGKGTG